MELNQISRIIFQDKNNYKHIDDKEKERLFFIFNQLISRGIPKNADNLNKKGILKDLALDVWFDFSNKTTKVPDWFFPNWSKIKMKSKLRIDEKYDDVDKWILSHYENIIVDKPEEIIEVKKLKKK